MKIIEIFVKFLIAESYELLFSELLVFRHIWQLRSPVEKHSIE